MEQDPRCSALGPEGAPCQRRASLPDIENGGMICDFHAWEAWRGGAEILPVLEAIGQGKVPQMAAARSLMWVLVESPVMALQIIIAGYAAMVDTIEATLQARDPELASEILSIGGHALAAKTASGLLAVPPEKRKLLMRQSGLGSFVRDYRNLVENEESR